MRFLPILICLGLAVGNVEVRAQTSSINGPLVGFLPDEAGASIFPIAGIPGASVLAAPIQLNSAIHGAVIAPKQDYALAVSNSDASVVLVNLANLSVVAVDGAQAAPALLAISPGGKAAGIYNGGSRTVQVIQGLPSAPAVTASLDASQVAGQPTAISISDDGAVVLMKTVTDDGGSGLWVIPSSGTVSRLPIAQPAAAAFFVNKEDAIVSDDATQSAFIVMDAGRAATQVPLVSAVDGMTGFSSIAASDDGGKVFLQDGSSGNVAIVDVQTRTWKVVACGCQAKGLMRLNGNSIFRFANASTQPVMVLDASGVEPRIVVVPPPRFVAIMGYAQ
ncbi:MAG TPA: hypothetical protein VGK48_22970 [Terriglobia bacterium]|jgi:hypothetical protein